MPVHKIISFVTKNGSKILNKDNENWKTIFKFHILLLSLDVLIEMKKYEIVLCAIFSIWRGKNIS